MAKAYEVFVLADSVDYEGESLLGVYSTMENAKEAANRWIKEDKGFWDSLHIYTVSIDAFPEQYLINSKQEIIKNG